MGKYAGFDTDRVGSLKTNLAAAAKGASGIAGDVSSHSRNAQHYLMLGYGVPHGAMAAEEADPSTGPVTTLHTIGNEGSTTAAEIARRLAHLEGVEKIAADGYHVDMSTVFEDSPAPDEAKIKKAAADLHTALHDTPLLNGAVTASYDALIGLNGTEAEAVLGALSDDELTTLDRYFTYRPAPIGARGPWPATLSDDQRIALTNAIFPGMGTDMLIKLGEKVPSLQPIDSNSEDRDKDFQKGLHYKWVGGEPIPDTVSPEDLNQGDLGDCWFLASLGAEVRADPRFAAKHILDNGNGTYTVTLYRDGKAVPVTVDANLPVNQDDYTVFSHNPSGSSANWVQIYEKAFAQLNGSYGATEGGWGDVGMTDVSGQHSTRHDEDDLSFSQIKGDLDSGKPVTVGSGTHHSGFLWLHSDETFPDTDVVTAHEYVVMGVDPDKHTITLRNPWGQGSSVKPDLVLTEDQFHDMFREVSVGND